MADIHDACISYQHARSTALNLFRELVLGKIFTLSVQDWAKRIKIDQNHPLSQTRNMMIPKLIAFVWMFKCDSMVLQLCIQSSLY